MDFWLFISKWRNSFNVFFFWTIWTFEKKERCWLVDQKTTKIHIQSFIKAQPMNISTWIFFDNCMNMLVSKIYHFHWTAFGFFNASRVRRNFSIFTSRSKSRSFGIPSQDSSQMKIQEFNLSKYGQAQVLIHINVNSMLFSVKKAVLCGNT